ncbi:deferrochelatase/peroxidase EfeB [Friedmanniella endophytica]|uniref:Deferrochelatase n=1 Tax=Microlunatus kandeliicorticis TaxID=1759536 RepID=A0A7W3P5G1_9ACTN|nr:iron uptake transporter deferrochelatase/peroxidase subunit [Microlunatus kandeliicorticis]MBA8793827.1 deferrochelatase/peroxidase EfeB [Microlunatus kandeliicorticis]
MSTEQNGQTGQYGQTGQHGPTGQEGPTARTGPEQLPPDPVTTAGEPAAEPRRGVSRRGLLGAAGVGVAGVGAGIAGTLAVEHRADAGAAAATGTAVSSYPFWGSHQAGIVTPAQDWLHFAAFDLTSSRREDLVALLTAWTAAAARMTQGHGAGPVGPTSGDYAAPPDDTGEAIGLPPSGLTLTFGFGPTLFRDARGRDRFGLADRQPDALRELPQFPGDNLDPARSGGDLCIQACADDPQVAVHAIRNLARIGFGTVAVRWSQLGFGRTSATTTGQATPRNLFGFKDGTANVKAEETLDVDRHVWVPHGADARAGWLEGGSYLVARRISMDIEIWDRQALSEQERVIGRTKAEGAPLSGGTEFSAPNFSAQGAAGPLIDTTSHVHQAHPDVNRGVRMLRRGYNFVDGSTGLGRLDAGLFFLAYVTDPRTHYIPVQNKVSRDAMAEYVQHTGSGLFAIPPGVQQGQFVGQALFA